MTDVHEPDPERKAAADAEWADQGGPYPAQLAPQFTAPEPAHVPSVPTPDELAAIVAKFGGGEDRRPTTGDGPHPGQELAQASDDYMQMLDPERPWRLLTSDGHAWVQCADCDSWLQADDALTLEEAKLIALLHRNRDWPHVQAKSTPKAKAKRRLIPWRKRPAAMPRVIGGRRCPSCGINEVNDRCANGACPRSSVGAN